MPELFWIIVGYTVVLGLCFLLGEYLQDRRNAKKRQQLTEEKTACEAAQPKPLSPCCAEDPPPPNDPPSEP